MNKNEKMGEGMVRERIRFSKHPNYSFLRMRGAIDSCMNKSVQYTHTHTHTHTHTQTHTQTNTQTHTKNEKNARNGIIQRG